jgi:BlaI family transcriptional regulator, penicillinase repressor
MTPKPTDAELSILQVLWQNGDSTVRSINNTLNNSNDDGSVGYTTTLKIMQIMTEKGLLTRDESNRTHIYAAAVQENEVQSAFMTKLIDSVFRGSAMNLVLQALGTNKPSTSELQQIRALLDEDLQETSTSKKTMSSTKKK